MQGAEFIDSIRSASTQNLKQAYVLMTKTSITKMVIGKFMETSDFIQRKEKFDHYQHFVDKEVALINDSKEDLTFDVITVFAKTYDVSLSSINTQQGLHEFGDHILDKTVQSYRSMNKKFTGNTFEDVVHHFFKKMFEEVGKKYKTGSQKDKEKLDQAFESFIADLPEHQKEKLKKELNVSDLSQQMINRIIATNGTVVLFSALVNTMGFSFYMGATSLLASGASLLGLTLPFAAYTSMTSLIAVLASPVFFLGVIAISGFYFTKQRSKVIDMMSFLAVMQLFFSQESEEEPCSFDQINQRWKTKCMHYQHLLREINRTSTDRSEKISAIESSTIQKSTFEKKIADVENRIDEKLNEISLGLKNRRLEPLKEHHKLVQIINQLQEIERDIHTRSKKMIGRQDLFEKMKAGLLNSKNTVLVKEREWKQHKLYRDMANLVVFHDLPLFDVERNLIKTLNDQQSTTQQELTKTISQIQLLKSERNRLKNKQHVLELERKEMCVQYPGIDQMTHGGEGQHVIYS